MISEKIFTEMALSFSGAEQTPHFERIGFRVMGKRMFATYLSENNTANIFLTPGRTKGILQNASRWHLSGSK